MFTSQSNADSSDLGAADMLIPLIRAAATIGFAIAPCSLGFVIIAVSEQLIRSIMVGDDPEMLVSDLQNQFPDDAIAINDHDDAELMAKVVDLIERPDQASELPLDIRGTDFQMLVREALRKRGHGGDFELRGRCSDPLPPDVVGSSGQMVLCSAGNAEPVAAEVAVW